MKRFLLFLLSFAIVLVGTVLVAGLIFTHKYNDLQEEQTLAAQGSAAEADGSAETGNQVQYVLTGEDGSFVVNDDTYAENSAEDEAEAASEAANNATPAAPVADDSMKAQAQELVANMTLDEKICQMLFVTQETLTGYSNVTESGQATATALESYPVGGIIYFAQNLVSVDQTTSMIADIQSFSKQMTGRGLFIGVDEEGGTVARVADNLGTTSFGDMCDYGAAGDVDAVYNIGATQASELKALGFNVNFAPCADVLTNSENTVVSKRSFGSDPDLVSQMVAADVKGLTEGGILCAPKHFPGHGSTGGDTHDGFVSTDITMDELTSCDLLPFEAAIDAGAPMIMVGHMTLTNIDADNPASLSQTVVTGILRDQLGYDGIIITDAMNMGAITDLYSYGEATVKAFQAGCDMVLCVSNLSSVVATVEAAVNNGTLSEDSINESCVRILTAKLQYGILE